MLAMSMNQNREWPDLIAKTRVTRRPSVGSMTNPARKSTRLILQMINHPQVAEEVTMDVYVQVWKQARV